MEKENTKRKLRMRCDAAGSLELDLREGDAIQQMLSTPDGLIVISKWRTCKIRTPDCIDPKRHHDDAPWQQSILFESGTERPLVARTVVQVQQFLQQISSETEERRRSIFDIAFRAMKSLLSLERTLKRLRYEVNARVEFVSDAIEQYVEGRAPRPIQPILTLEDDFKAFALEVRQCLNHITDLFEPTLGLPLSQAVLIAHARR